MQKNHRTRKRTSPATLKVHQRSLSEPFRERLANGVTVIGECIPNVESVAIGVWVSCGSRDERKDENGLTHLIEHMVFKGTEHFTAEELVGTIEGNGGYINAFTTKEFSCYYAKVFSSELTQAVRVLSDLVISPRFTSSDLENERKVVLSEMQEVYDDPEDWGMDFIEEKIYEGNSLSMPIIGRAGTLRSFDTQDLRRFHSKNFTAERVVISAAGNFDKDFLLGLADRYFAPLQKSSTVYMRRRPSAKRKGSYTIRRGGGRQAHLILGGDGPGLDHPARYAASMVGVILGDGSSSRLYKEIREKDGLAYSIYSYGSAYVDTSVTGVYACTATRDFALAEKKIHSAIEEFVRNGPTREEVERARAQLKAGIIFSLENPWDRASMFARDEICYSSVTGFSESLESIEKVTETDVAQAAVDLTKAGLASVKILPRKSKA